MPTLNQQREVLGTLVKNEAMIEVVFEGRLACPVFGDILVGLPSSTALHHFLYSAEGGI
jgi:hypothetical protein